MLLSRSPPKGKGWRCGGEQPQPGLREAHVPFPASRLAIISCGPLSSSVGTVPSCPARHAQLQPLVSCSRGRVPPPRRFCTPPSSQPALPPAESDYPGEWAAGARGRGWHHLGRCPKGAPILPRGLGAACALERCLGLRRSHRLGHCILIRGEGLSSGRGDGGGGAGLQGQRRRPPGQRFSDLRGQQDPLEEAGCELWSL